MNVNDARPIHIGGLYRHFKGGVYRVLDLALDATTMRDAVIYQNIRDCGKWVRPLDEFLSAVDKTKYPDATQKWRFAEIKEHRYGNKA